MPKRNPVATDVKQQILDRVKEGGISISQIAEEHGISNRTIYGWLSKGATASPSWLELNKLKRENSALKELLGRVMLEIELSKKRIDHDCQRKNQVEFNQIIGAQPFKPVLPEIKTSSRLGAKDQDRGIAS